jgi:hypothetical protein
MKFEIHKKLNMLWRIYNDFYEKKRTLLNVSLLFKLSYEDLKANCIL